jgi:hypothetical protein
MGIRHIISRTGMGFARGIPKGGSTGQTLQKTSGTDYDVDWENPPAGSSSPTTTKGDMIVRDATEDKRLPIGFNGYQLNPDSVNSLGLKWAPPYPDPAFNLVAFTDFLEGLTRSPFTGQTISSGSVSSGGAGATGFCGTITLDTSTSSSGTAGINGATGSNMTLGLDVNGRRFSVKTRLYMATLPTVSEDYYVFVGFSNASSGADLTAVTASCGLYYSSASPNWQLFKRVSGANTFVDTGVPVVAATNYTVEFVAVGNATVGNIEFELFVNGVSVGTMTGFVNTAITPWPAYIRKLAGTGVRQLIVDAAAVAMGRA